VQFELGARFEDFDVVRSGDRLSLNVNAYYANVRNFIDQTVSFIDFGTAVSGPDGLVVGGSTTTENVDAKLWGAELEARYDAGPWFAGLAISIPRGEGEGGAALGSIPQDRLTASFGLRPMPDVELGARATFAAEQNDVPDETTPGGAYTVVDLFASWTPRDGALKGGEFRVGIDNVFDETYRIYPNGLNQTGRSFKLSAAMRF
jgi:hemoglobin/transferrin/lactoferrin receptor protein